MVRNFLQYPVTKEEKLNLLRELCDQFLAEERVGDPRPHILAMIARDVEAADDRDEYADALLHIFGRFILDSSVRPTGMTGTAFRERDPTICKAQNLRAVQRGEAPPHQQEHTE